MKIKTQILHHIYLEGWGGRYPPRWLRRVLAKTELHRAWLTGRFGICSNADGTRSSITTITCKHEFDLADLRQTGIPAPERPAQNDFASWEKWYSAYDDSEHVKKRVVWPCCRCGKLFYANCGLDIYKHGTPKPTVFKPYRQNRLNSNQTFAP